MAGFEAPCHKRAMIRRTHGERRNAKRVLLLAAAWLGGSQAAWAGSVPYEKLLSLSREAEFEAIPPASRDKVLFVAVISHADAADHTPIHLWVMDGTTRTDIPIGEHGRFHMPVRADWAARHLDVQTDQPTGSLRLTYDITLAPPQGLVIPIAYLRDGMAQVQEILRQAYRQTGGYLAQFAAPHFTRVKISFATCCGETAIAGQVVMKEDATGNIVVPAEVLQGTGMLTLSAPGVVFDLE